MSTDTPTAIPATSTIQAETTTPARGLAAASGRGRAESVEGSLTPLAAAYRARWPAAPSAQRSATVQHAFQPKGGGRSGRSVKNLTGPPNSAIRSTSKDRIFVTDGNGNVIADVKAGRIKMVTPGQGFTGEKISTSPGYLDLLKKVLP
jgi:hypothetical protein